MAAPQATTTDIRKDFRDAGFEVVELAKSPESVEVRKSNCTLALERIPGGGWIPSGPPRFLVRGMKCELEDRGYQKFWHSSGKRFPIRVNDLKALHRFHEEVRAIVGEKSLYHESLGTTCARSTYDRMHGRPDR